MHFVAIRLIAVLGLAAAPALAAAGFSVDGDPSLAAVAAARQATVTIRLPGPDGEEEAIGAGFILANSGQIVTNAHVIAGQSSIRIETADGIVVTATVVARDTVNDIALLSAPVSGVARLSFAGEPVEVGETVFAVGSPFGLGQSVTRGIVSALDRAIDATTPFGMIQHDAPLNPGSSGGPVINQRGEVIGINTAMPDGFRRDVGVAYAIPAEVVERVVERLASGAAVPMRKLGVSLRALTPRLAAAVGVAPDIGVLVESVASGSAAFSAGLVPSDVIVAIGDGPVGALRDVAVALDRADPAASLDVYVIRAMERIVLALPPAEMASPEVVETTDKRSPRRWIEAERLGFTLDEREPARVIAVERGGPASAAGVVPGDRIVAVGRTRVDSALQVKRLIGPVVTEPFALLLADDDGATRYTVVDPWAPGLDADRLGGNMRHPKSASF